MYTYTKSTAVRDNTNEIEQKNTQLDSSDNSVAKKLNKQ